jgi:hypothetical protein
MSFYACFMLQNRPMPEKFVIQSRLSFMAATFSPTSRWGRGAAVGGGGKATKQNKSLLTVKTRHFIHRLSASQTSEHLLPEVKDVGFCVQIIISVIKF